MEKGSFVDILAKDITQYLLSTYDEGVIAKNFKGLKHLPTSVIAYVLTVVKFASLAIGDECFINDEGEVTFLSSSRVSGETLLPLSTSTSTGNEIFYNPSTDEDYTLNFYAFTFVVELHNATLCLTINDIPFLLGNLLTNQKGEKTFYILHVNPLSLSPSLFKKGVKEEREFLHGEIKSFFEKRNIKINSKRGVLMSDYICFGMSNDKIDFDF